MKLIEEKILHAFEESFENNNDFEFKSIEYNEKGWWDIKVKSFYGISLHDLIDFSFNVGIDEDDIMISSLPHIGDGKYIGFNICIFDK